MLPGLGEIKTKRTQLGLTQAALAKQIGVSQSLIAKTESGALVPTYLKAKKIFDFFDSVREKKQLTAQDLMNSSVKKIQENDSIKSAIKLMKNNAISQLPVVEGEKIVGVVSEDIIVERMQKAKDLEEFKEQKISEIMGESPPTVGENAPFSAISALLDYNSSILVLKNGKIRGIISRTDLLGSVLEKNK